MKDLPLHGELTIWMLGKDVTGIDTWRRRPNATPEHLPVDFTIVYVTFCYVGKNEIDINAKGRC